MFKLTKDNIDILHKEIPIKKITKTFANALTVTQALGLQYLWIDSLCIVQDDVEDVRNPYFILGYSSFYLAAKNHLPFHLLPIEVKNILC
jgi:hypothetical protein